MSKSCALLPGNARCIRPYCGATDYKSLVSFWPVELVFRKHLFKRGGCKDVDFVIAVKKAGDSGRGVVLLASRKDVCLSVYSLRSLEPIWVDCRIVGAGVATNCLAARYVGDGLLIAVGRENGYVSVYRSVDGETVPSLIRELDAVDRGFGGSWTSTNDAVLSLEISSKGHIVVAMDESVSLFNEDGNLFHRWSTPEMYKEGEHYWNASGQKQWSMTIHESSSTYRVYACCCMADNFEVTPSEDGGGGSRNQSKRRLCPILLYQLSHPFTIHRRYFSQMKACYVLKMSCSDLSSDGSTLVTGTLEGTVCVWDTETGVLMYSLPCISAVRAVLFLCKEGSSASRFLLSIDAKGNLKIWDNGHYLRSVHTCWTRMTVIDHSSLRLAMWGDGRMSGTVARSEVAVVYLGSMFYLIRWQIVLLCELFFRGRAERRVKGDALTRLLCRILPDLYCQRDAFRCMLSFII